MAVAFDAVSSALEVAGDGVISVSHTAGGTDRAVMMHNTSSSSAVIDTSSITYAGNAGTEMWDISDAAQVITGAGYRLAGDANIPTGAQTVTATMASAPDNQVLGVISMTGVDATTPVGTPATIVDGAALPTTATVTVGSVGTDDLVVDGIIVSQAGAIVVGAGQTQRYTQTNLALIETRGSTQLGSSGGVMSWDLSVGTSAAWCLGAVAFKPAAAAAAETVVPQRTLTGVGL